MMIIRNASMQDLDIVTHVEAVCFPEAEAASKKTMKDRLSVYPEYFWIIQDGETVIGFIDGPVVNQPAIIDEMFANTSMHDKNGLYQSVFGLSVLPEYRKQGYASKLMEALIEDARKAGRKGCILTCKERLISYYEKFGYRNQGVSKSEHGGAVWYDMLLEF